MKLKNKVSSAVVDDIIPIEIVYDENWQDSSAEFDLEGAIAYTNGDYDEYANNI